MISEVRNIVFIKSVTLMMLVMLFCINLSAQNVEAYAKVDTDSIMIGDQVKMELGITIPESFAVSFPFFVDTLTTNIEVLNKEPLDTTTVDDGMLIKQLYTITSFDSGYFKLPEFEFLFHHTDDTILYRTDANTLYLMVNTPQVDTSLAFKVIKGPIGEPYTFAEIFPWILLGLVVIGIIVFVIWYLRKRRKNQPVFVKKQKPMLPPDILAIQKLEELRLAKIWQQGKLKTYYTDLTDIARTYFDGQLDIDALEMTSDEIIEALNKKQINKQAIEKMRSVLQLADLVKFAKSQPTPLENDLSLNHCIDFVMETKPVAVPDPAIVKESEKPIDKEDS